ncbi:methionine--tRNA ligase [bacterium]|nr:methionine--tRNA ligase [bacterium]
MTKKRKLLVTSALPYSNGPIHIGHIAGAYLPADIFVRYHRLKGDDVVFICGADEHGVPITIAARKRGITPQQLVDEYYVLNRDSFAGLGIKFDNFSRTSLLIHHATSQEFFLKMHRDGKLVSKESKQFYDEEHKMFLADRYVQGTCPHCGNTNARGDQCEKCGSWLDPMSLINPRSVISGTVPVVKSTTHWYLPMARFQKELEDWLATKKDWKDNVMNYCGGWFKEGLGDRAITRDLEWGIPVPLPDSEGKVLYVWFDAPIGYISATKEWAEKIGEPERWKDYWKNPECEVIHFIGKDNIVFHAIFFPAVLMAQEGYNLPSQIPANEFLNLEGRKLSTSRDYAVWVPDYLKSFAPDILRYTLAANLPENKDADFSWKMLQRCNNDELANILGNFINRTVTFLGKYFDSKVPENVKLSPEDEAVLDEMRLGLKETGELIDHYKNRQAVGRAMDMARAANRYYDASEPWKLRKENMERCGAVMYTCARIIRALNTVFHPFIPFSADALFTMMNFPGKLTDAEWDDAWKEEVAGITIKEPRILFSKLEDKDIEPELQRLAKAVERMEKEEAEEKKAADEYAKAAEGKKASGEAPEGTVSIEKISIEDLEKIDLRVGRILSAEAVPKADKLLKLQVSFGSEERQILAGIALYYKPEEIVGKNVVAVCNLPYRKMKGLESQGMLLCACTDDKVTLLTTDSPEVDPGTPIQ